jgi:hypothetical protein
LIFLLQTDVREFFVHLSAAATVISNPYKRRSFLEITVSLARIAQLLHAKIFVQGLLDQIGDDVRHFDRAFDAVRNFTDKHEEKVKYILLSSSSDISTAFSSKNAVSEGA